jgi:hypothetical protein
MKSRTIAEGLIMPACKIIVRTVIGKEAEIEIDEVPVSDNTFSGRVGDMSHDFEDVLSEMLKNTNFALQVDESADITNKAQLLAFVRFENEGEIMDFCCCKELPKTTEGQEIFNILSSYLESYGLSWNQCAGICTNGEPSMIGSEKGFVTLVKEDNHYVIMTHCFLHCEVLVSKTAGEDLKQVLDVAVSVVHFVKQPPLLNHAYLQSCVKVSTKST